MTDVETAEALLGDDDGEDYDLGQDEEAELLREDEDDENILTFQTEPLDEDEDEDNRRDKFASERQNNKADHMDQHNHHHHHHQHNHHQQNATDYNRFKQHNNNKMMMNNRGGRGRGRGGNRPQFHQQNVGRTYYVKPELLKGTWEKKPVQSVQPWMNHSNYESNRHVTTVNAQCLGQRYQQQVPPHQQQQQQQQQQQYPMTTTQQFGQMNQNLNWQSPPRHQQPAATAPLVPASAPSYGGYYEQQCFPPQTSYPHPPQPSTPQFQCQTPPTSYYPNQTQAHFQPEHMPLVPSQQQQQAPFQQQNYLPHAAPALQQQQPANFHTPYTNQYNVQPAVQQPPPVVPRNQLYYEPAHVQAQAHSQPQQNQMFTTPPQQQQQQFQPRLGGSRPRHFTPNHHHQHQQQQRQFSPRLPFQNNFRPRSSFNNYNASVRFMSPQRGYHNQGHQGYQGQFNQYKRRNDNWNPSDGQQEQVYPKRRSWNHYQQNNQNEEYEQEEWQDEFEEGTDADYGEDGGRQVVVAQIDPTPEIEEDEETKAYRRKIEEQKRQRQEILDQKEKNRKLQILKKTGEVPAAISTVATSQRIVTTTTMTKVCATNPNLRVIQRQDIVVPKVAAADTGGGSTIVSADADSTILSSSFLATRKVIAKDDALFDTPVVMVRNLAASASEPQLRKLCHGVGLVQSFEMSSKERQAKIRFKSVASAHAFYKKYQRYMLDLSMIQVELVPN